MDNEKVKYLLNKKNIKDMNNMDSTPEIEELNNELKKVASTMTYSEIREYEKLNYIKEFNRIPTKNHITNLSHILNDFKDLIDDFENIIKSDNEINKKKAELALGERKVGIILEYLANIITDYIKPVKTAKKDDNMFLEEAKRFLNALNGIEETFDQNINDYYTATIKFYRFFCTYTQNAISRYDKELLWYICFWACGVLVFRSDVIIANYLQ